METLISIYIYIYRLLRVHLLSVTLLTTPAYSPSIRSSLLDTTISVVDLPFPVGIPGTESTNKLPSMSLFQPHFVNSAKLIHPHFERAIQSLAGLSSRPARFSPFRSNEFEPPFNELEPKGPHFDFVAEACAAVFKSHSLLVNSFTELAPRFNDSWNGARAWCIGVWPSQSRLYKSRPGFSGWMRSQLKESRTGLKTSYVAFLWF